MVIDDVWERFTLFMEAVQRQSRDSSINRDPYSRPAMEGFYRLVMSPDILAMRPIPQHALKVMRDAGMTPDEAGMAIFCAFLFGASCMAEFSSLSPPADDPTLN